MLHNLRDTHSELDADDIRGEYYGVNNIVPKKDNNGIYFLIL